MKRRSSSSGAPAAAASQEFNTLVYLIFLIQGLALLTPWNVVLNS